MSQSILCRFWLALVMVVALGSAGPAPAGEAFYLIMYASQRTPPNPNYSHTFATVVRVTWEGDGPCPKNARLEAHTLSWLPANLIIRVNALKPECGHNFSLKETLEAAYATGQRVSLWGPYQIEPGLYFRALDRKAELESGRIKYKADDTFYRSDRVSNCIHAVSTIVEGPRLRVASPGWGQSASWFVLEEMRQSIIAQDPEPWVGSALGLDAYPIIYRDYRNPRSNAITGPFFRLLGNERGIQPSYGPQNAYGSRVR